MWIKKKDYTKLLISRRKLEKRVITLEDNYQKLREKVPGLPANLDLVSGFKLSEMSQKIHSAT